MSYRMDSALLVLFEVVSSQEQVSFVDWRCGKFMNP